MSIRSTAAAPPRARSCRACGRRSPTSAARGSSASADERVFPWVGFSIGGAASTTRAWCAPGDFRCAPERRPGRRRSRTAERHGSNKGGGTREEGIQVAESGGPYGSSSPTSREMCGGAPCGPQHSLHSAETGSGLTGARQRAGVPRNYRKMLDDGADVASSPPPSAASPAAVAGRRCGCGSARRRIAWRRTTSLSSTASARTRCRSAARRTPRGRCRRERAALQVRWGTSSASSTSSGFVRQRGDRALAELARARGLDAGASSGRRSSGRRCARLHRRPQGVGVDAPRLEGCAAAAQAADPPRGA